MFNDETFGFVRLLGNQFFSPSNQTSFNTEDIEWTKTFRDNYQNILNEWLTYQQSINHHDMPPHTFIALNKDLKWKTLTLLCYDDYRTNVSSQFPLTMNIIDTINKDSWIPKIHMAMFSILPPNKSLSIHMSYNRGVLRYQLGLQIPEHSQDDLYLFIYNDSSFNSITNINDSAITRLQWKNGSDFLFDDTCYHYVHNNMSDGTMQRIVLFLDVERHDLSIWMRLWHQIMIKVMEYFTPLCQTIDQNQNIFLNDEL